MMVRSAIATLLVGFSTTAGAQLRPSEPQAIAGAVADCWAAAGAKVIDQALLESRGWQAGSVTSPSGSPASSQLRAFSKPGTDVIVMLMQGGNSPVCTVAAKVNSAPDVSAAAQAVQKQLTTADPKVGTARSGKSIVFVSLPKIAMLDATGTKSDPGVRIAVSYNSSEKK